MKLAITGKGGVGKTTLAALLAGAFVDQGRPVIAIDATPDANLAPALGFSPSETASLVPIAEMKELVAERTGASPGAPGFFRLNPRVDDLPERFSLGRGLLRVLSLGTVKGGGAGCLCPEHALLRSLVAHLLIGRQEVVILDMEAGVEHLGRGTAQFVDAFLVVVEAGLRSLLTARTIQALAADLGVRRCLAVGSRVRDQDELSFIQEHCPLELLGIIHYHPELLEADRLGKGVWEASPRAREEVQGLKERLESLLGEGKGG